MPAIIPTVPFKRPDDKLLPFELIALKNNSLDQPEEHHRHDFYSMVLLAEGQCTQTVDFKAYSLKPAQALIIPKGSIHFGCFTKDLEGYFLLFTADFFDTYLSSIWPHLTIFNPLYERAVIEFCKSDWDYISQLVALLATEYHSLITPAENKVLQHLLLVLLMKMETVHKTSLALKATSSDNYYQQFFYLLDTNFRKEHAVGFYASELHVTSKKLSHILMERSGKSTADFITERLLLEAKRQLTYSHQTVKEIAYALGFNDPFYFSRLFKRKSGKSPEQFRIEVAKKSI